LSHINNLNNLGVLKLLALHHNAADFQLTKLSNCHEGLGQWFVSPVIYDGRNSVCS